MNQVKREAATSALGKFSPPGSTWAGILLVVLGSAFISFSAVFVRLCTVDPEVSSFYRMLFGGVVLLAVCLIKRESLQVPRLAFILLISAAILLSLDLVFWHYCIYLIGPGLATIVGNFNVFFMAPAGMIFYKERISPGLVFGLPMALIGLAFVMGLDGNGLSGTSLKGLVLGLIASFWYAGYVLVLRQSQRLPQRMSPLGSVTVMTFGCVLFMGLVVLAMGKSFAIPDMRNAAALVGYGFFSQALGWMFLTVGLPKLPASLGGPVMLLQPGLAFVWDIIFFGRAVNLFILFGAVLTLAGIYLAVTGQMRKNRLA